MKISIYGAGYVGLVSATCFAELGHDVCCIDIDPKKIEKLRAGLLPIYEDNLQDLLRKNLDTRRVQFTTDFQMAVEFAEIQMIAVGTPSKKDGAADLQYVEAVANKIAELMSSYRCIVNKSTVPMGTAHHIQKIISAQLKKRDIAFDVVSNPEFLREGRAVRDCLSPDRIVIGCESEKAEKLMRALYLPMTEKNCLFLVMDLLSAELTKYAANAFLAMKVSFINEISQIAERTGANIHAIKKGIGSDVRINDKFLNAGCGFGGSCFPKDMFALKYLAEKVGYTPHILNAVLQTNDQQQHLLFTKIKNYLKGDIAGKTIALWGLAFKPNTDDIRCATSLVLINQLLEAGAMVRAYDPLAMDNIRHYYQNEPRLVLCKTANAVFEHADVLTVVTEWDEFKNPDFGFIKKNLQFPAIFDGRNIYNGQFVRAAGIDYFGIGC